MQNNLPGDKLKTACLDKLEEGKWYATTDILRGKQTILYRAPNNKNLDRRTINDRTAITFLVISEDRVYIDYLWADFTVTCREVDPPKSINW